MLRSFFIYLSKANWARRMVTRWPVGWRMASRFIAGESLSDALRAIRTLNEKRIDATLDHLGEHTLSAEAAQNATHEILQALDALKESQVRANVSIKLTQIGLNIDRQLCASHLRTILDHARQCGNFIRVDMEDSSATQNTLELVSQMRREGYANVGVVIQAYLYRSDGDIENLIREGIPVRLCKGAYKEPPELAYPKKKDVNTAFDRMAKALIYAAHQQSNCRPDPGGKFPPLAALATHDEQRISFARALVDQLGLPKNCLEFQMLYGIRRDLQEQLAQEGYLVRVYVPYGTEWYPYFMRRLAERPANVWFLLSNFFRR